MKNSALCLVALIGAFLIGLSGLRAQSNTEYSFRQQHAIDGSLTSGDYEYALNGQNWPAGVYFVCLKSGNETVTKRIVKLP